jgi:glycosyltransferase involved in cell wall biosynthesis
VSDMLVYVPGQNSLRYLFPLVYVVSRLKRIELLCFVVGGWLAEHLQSRRLLVVLLSTVRGVFTESEQLNDKLRHQFRLKNVVAFPNFRMHHFVPSFRQDKDSFRVVFMGRIIPTKGIDAVFRLAAYIEERYKGEHTISIAFYGPIEDDDAEVCFKERLEKFPFMSYKGTIEPERVHHTLDQNDLVVLPTRYPGEGFPGTIIDAYISGIPVIVSKWKYLPEFVDEGLTGFIFGLDNEAKFYSDVEKLYRDRNLLLKMKHNAHQKSKSYSSERAWEILKEYFRDKSDTRFQET